MSWLQLQSPYLHGYTAPLKETLKSKDNSEDVFYQNVWMWSRFIPLIRSDTAQKKTKSVFPVKLVEEDKLSWQSKLGHLPLGTWAKYL